MYNPCYFAKYLYVCTALRKLKIICLLHCILNATDKICIFFTSNSKDTVPKAKVRDHYHRENDSCHRGDRSDAVPAEGCGEFRLALSPAPYSGISKFPQERTLCEIWVRELSSRPPSSTAVVDVVVVAKIKSARLRSLQAVWGWPWVAYCSSNLLVLSFQKRSTPRANPFALIAWLSVDRNVSNIDRVYVTGVWHYKFKIC